MTPPSKPDRRAAPLHLLAAAGPRSRHLAGRLDLVRSTGVRYAVRRLREKAHFAAFARPDAPLPAYERIWRDAAAELEADVVDIGSGFLEIRKGAAWTRVWNHWVMLDDIVTTRLALDKTLVHRLLADAGVRVPDYVKIEGRDLAPARAFLAHVGGPCIVKPAGSSGGSGITSGVRCGVDLARAVVSATRVDRTVLVERQIEGDVYRFLFLDGELLDVVRRRPARVTGDGRSSVGALIAAENGRRVGARDKRVLVPLRVDLDAVFTLRDAGLTLRSVPAAGEEVVVKRVISENRVEDNETVRDVGEGLVADAARAASAVGLRLAGVDLVTRDVSRPLSETGGAVLEVNGTPGLHYHYEVADGGRASRVAVPVLRTLLA